MFGGVDSDSEKEEDEDELIRTSDKKKKPVKNGLVSKLECCLKWEKSPACPWQVVASNMEIIMQMYPSCRKEIECSFLLGTFLEQVHREVMSGEKELLVSTLRGVSRARHPAVISTIYCQSNHKIIN